MPSKKKLIFIISVSLVFLVLLYYSRPLGNRRTLSQENALKQMEQEIHKLRIEAHTLVDVNSSLRSAQKKIAQSAGMRAVPEKVTPVIVPGIEQESLERLQNQLKSLEESIGSVNVRSAIPQLKKQLSLLRGQFESTQRLLSSISQARQNAEQSVQLTARRKEVESLQTRLKNSLQEKLSLEKQAESLNANIKEIDNRLSQLEEQNRKLEDSLCDAKNTNDQLREDSRIRDKDFKDLQVRHVQLIQEKRDAMQIKEDILAKSAQLQDNLAALLTRSRELEQKLDDVQSRAEKADKERLLLLKDLQEARGHLRGLEALKQELSSAKSNLDNAVSENKRLAQEYKSLQEESLQKEVTLRDRADRILQLQDKISGIEGKIARAQTSLTQAQKDAAILREQNVALGLEKDRLQAQLLESGKALNETQAKLERINQVFSKSDLPDNASLSQAQPEKNVEVELVPEGQPDQQKHDE